MEYSGKDPCPLGSLYCSMGKNMICCLGALRNPFHSKMAVIWNLTDGVPASDSKESPYGAQIPPQTFKIRSFQVSLDTSSIGYPNAQAHFVVWGYTGISYWSSVKFC